MRLRLKGSLELSKLEKKDIIFLITNYSYEEIGEKYNVSYSVVARIMSEKFEEFYIPGNIKKNGALPIRLKSTPKEPFSINEDDYGLLKEKKNIITKEGLLEVKGNKDLDEISPTPLKLAIDTYKEMIKSN